MIEKLTIGPRRAGILEQGQHASAVNALGGFATCQLDECRNQVDVGSEVIAGYTLAEFSFPGEEGGNHGAALVGAFLAALEPGMESREFHAVALAHGPVSRTGEGGAVVRHEDDQGLLLQTPFLEVGHETADVVINVLDHAVEAPPVTAEPVALEFLPLACRGDEGPVRGVGRNVSEEGFVPVLPDPAQGLGEEHISAEAGGFHEAAVVMDDRILVGIARRVHRLGNAARAVNKDLVKAALSGSVTGSVAEVPFAKNAGDVARFCQVLGQGGGRGSQTFPATPGVGDPILEGVVARHQGGAGGGAGRADVEVGEADTTCVQGIEVRGFQPRVAVASELGVALVIGEYQDDVRAAAREIARQQGAGYGEAADATKGGEC